jgi:dihydrodipicolinate synthase/N-acetylneuraminate lyase
MSAVLLPYRADGSVDWAAFDSLLDRTIEAGLVPAVNMDTGYVNLIDEPTRTMVLEHAQAATGPKGFVAGAFVDDEPDDPFDPDAYVAQLEVVQAHGGLPIVFQSFGLSQLPGDEVVRAYEQLAGHCDRFFAFELSPQFAPFGRIYHLDVYQGLLSIPQCVGAKHSSLNRIPEWGRLALRDRIRPDFKVLTGNDLAIDMVMYGSDYLLGLSAFAPDYFAARDRSWEEGNPGFYELNDRLQFLGAFAFRDPVPAYRHSAAQFLHLRGWLDDPSTHPDSPRRPDSDVEVLERIAEGLDVLDG